MRNEPASTCPLEPGQVLEVRIERIAYGGNGVAHPDGFTLFIPRTAPDDVASVTVTDVRRRYGRAHVSVLISPSNFRTTPFCKFYEDCGGCQYQHLNENLIAELRSQHVQDSLERLGSGTTSVSPLRPAGKTRNYRNRVTYHRDTRGCQGYISMDRRGVLDVTTCPIAREGLNELWGRLRREIADIPALDLPFVVLRETTSGQQAIILSGTNEKLPSQLRLHLAPLLEKSPKPISLYFSLIQPGSRSPFGKILTHLEGPKDIVESIHGVHFFLRPDLFFQIHPEVAEQIVSDVLSVVSSCRPTRVLDLYAGVGLFALCLAQQGSSVLAVDSHYPAICAGQRSADENRLSSHVVFRAGKAERIVERLHRKGERFELALLDPPRKGLSPHVVQTLSRLGIRRVLYLSCSPATFARDEKLFLQNGFTLQSVVPYDMFPQTYHVEILGDFVRQ